jgi:hypothetical protein
MPACPPRRARAQVIVLDRPRHAELVAQIRSAGARIRMIADGDVAAAIATAMPGSGVDVLMGVGGCAEGVIAAAALKCMGGAIQGRLWPRHEADRAAIVAAGMDPSEVRGRRARARAAAVATPARGAWLTRSCDVRAGAHHAAALRRPGACDDALRAAAHAVACGLTRRTACDDAAGGFFRSHGRLRRRPAAGARGMCCAPALTMF